MDYPLLSLQINHNKVFKNINICSIFGGMPPVILSMYAGTWYEEICGEPEIIDVMA